MLFEQIFRSLVANINDVVMVMDATPLDDGGPKIIYVNPAFEQLMGYTAEEVVGQNPKLLQGPGTDDETRFKIRDAMRHGKGIRTQILNYDKHGKELWLDINMVPLFDADGELAYYAAIERDLTEYKRLQSHLENMATTDSLTGLPNRAALIDCALKEFDRARRYVHPLSVVMIDVDHFKSVNDKHGHAIGDQVLQAVGVLCQKGLRGSDLLGRVGGEEFVLLLPDTPKANAIFVAERMREQLAKSPISLASLTLSITASFGVACISEQDADFNDILRRADAAMYQAKQNGRNQVQAAV
jgi:diguanylate cyclase (GGDEF)-like protein/PAS domain S-box-containing protein